MTPLIREAMLAVSNSLAASIVAKATIIAVMGLIGVWLARRNRAAVRHALLAAVFGVLLVLPIASIVSPPIRIAVLAAPQERTLPAVAATTGVIASVAPARGSDHTASTVPLLGRLSPSALLLAAWITGTVLFLLPVVVGLWQVHSLRRSALPWRRGQSVVDGLALGAGIHRRVEVLLHGAVPGPMTSGILRPAIMLSRDAQAWDAEDLNRAIVHELEHIRRGDWLSHCLARAVYAAYWFHPLVWIAWRKLVLEAERSCDDAVLASSESTAYADQLVGLARRLSMAPKSPLLAMANRTDLATRVHAVLDSRQRRGRAGRFSLALAVAGAAVLSFSTAPVRIAAAPQSDPTPNAQGPPAAIPEFDAVSVKLIDPNSQGEHIHERNDPGRIRMIENLHRFVRRAYGITEGQLGGEPDWFKTRLYSIEAVTSTRASSDQLMLMLRGVLADRFQLRLRQEYRDLPVYALEIAEGGPKFRELKPGEVPKDQAAPSGTFARAFSSVEDLMNGLNGMFGGELSMDRPVVDRTHLTGSYDMQFSTEMENQFDDLGRRTSLFPNLFQDLQRELGLKLVPERVRMPYFVVERAEGPTPN